MSDYLTVSEVSKVVEVLYGVQVNPKAISDLLYQRKLDVRVCPMFGGRRFVPRDLLPTVVRLLRERAVVIEN